VNFDKKAVIASARQLPGEAIQMRVWIAGAVKEVQ
jgi:hypothetical protein